MLKLDRIRKAKYLGVVIDDELLWQKQVNGVTQKLFCKIALLRRLSVFLDSSTMNILYKSLVQPHFDYCSVICCGRFTEDVHKLIILQKRCARIILGNNSLTSSTVMFPKLGWKVLQDRCDYVKSLLVFKAINTPKIRLEAYMLVNGCLQPILMIGKIRTSFSRNGRPI